MNKKQLLKVAVLTAISSYSFGMSASAAEQTEAQPAEQVAASAAVNPSYSLGEIVVESERETMPGGFIKNEAYVGILGKQDVMSIPFTVTSVGAKTLENFANPANGVTDALSFAPSVRTEKGGYYTETSVRGFRESGYGICVNGIPGLLAMESTPSNFVESVTIVSGPNIGVNGSNVSGNVGGSINFKTKVAQEDPVNTFGIAYRGGGTIEETIDYGQRFGKNGQWGVRVNASNTNGKTVVSHGRTDKRNVYVNIDQKSKKSETNLFMGYSYAKERATQGSFSLKDEVTSMPTAPKATRNYKPEWAYHEHENYVLALNHTQKLSDHLNAFLKAGYHDQKWFGFADTFDGGGLVIDKDGAYSGSLTSSPMRNKTTYIGVGINGDFKLGTVKNNYTLSVDYNKIDSYIVEDYLYTIGTVSGTLASGIFGVTGGPETIPMSHWKTHTITGWHFVDTMKALDDKLQVTLGAHGHKAKRKEYIWSNQDNNTSAITPTFAVSYKVSPTTTVFADHTEYFDLGKDYTVNGKRFSTNPCKSKQNEFGVKIKTGNMVNTLSFFDIKKPSYKKAVGTAPNQYLPQYTQKNKGIEWAITGKISDKWDLLGAFMYLNAEQDNGKAVDGVARWSAQLGSIYHFNKDLSAKLRMNYVGTAKIQDEKFTVPSHLTFDLGATYKSKMGKTPVTYDLMCYNLFGKDYWTTSAGANELYLGSPRTVTFSMNFEI